MEKAARGYILEDSDVMFVVKVPVETQYSVPGNCLQWMHKRWGGVNGSKPSKSSVCRGCTDQPASTARTIVNLLSLCLIVDIGDGASLELVDKFCYLSDTLSTDDDQKVLMRLWRLGYERDAINLGNWHLCLPIQTFTLLWEGSFRSCVQSCMLHSSESWLVKKRARWHFSRPRLKWLGGCVALQ